MTKKEKARLLELETNAKEKYLEYSDFNVLDWLEPEEAKEYDLLWDKLLGAYKGELNEKDIKKRN